MSVKVWKKSMQSADNHDFVPRVEVEKKKSTEVVDVWRCFLLSLFPGGKVKKQTWSFVKGYAPATGKLQVPKPLFLGHVPGKIM